jgi:type II secretory pathway component PulK
MTSKNKFKKDIRHKGSILILVLVIISGMTILAFGLAYRSRIEIRVAHENSQRTKAYHLALGGIERIKVYLSDEENFANSDISLGIRLAHNCPFTGTAAEENLFEDNTENSGQDVILAYYLSDEQGFFNLNGPGENCWTIFPEVEEPDVASIIDWRDQDDDESPNGAETPYYQNLTHTYSSKNRDFSALRELLFIKDINIKRYMGTDLYDCLVAKNDNEEIIANPFNPDNRSAPGLIDVFTVYGNGSININTASQYVLDALFQGHDMINGTQEILSHRLSWNIDEAFESYDDYKDFSTNNGLPVLPEGACCFTSEYLRIYSFAKVKNSMCCLVATVKLVKDDEPQILYLERLI